MFGEREQAEEREKRRLIVLSLTSPQGWSEEPETEKPRMEGGGEVRRGERGSVEETTQVDAVWRGVCAYV